MAAGGAARSHDDMEGAMRAPVRGCVPFTGHRSSPQSGLKQGPALTSMPSGSIVRPDGSHQVTYNGRPLYLFNNDAYIGPPAEVGTQGIYGADAHTPLGCSTRSRRCPSTLPPRAHRKPRPTQSTGAFSRRLPLTDVRRCLSSALSVITAPSALRVSLRNRACFPASRRMRVRWNR